MSVRGIAKVGFIPQPQNEVRPLSPRRQLLKSLMIETDLSVPGMARKIGIKPGTAKVYCSQVFDAENAANGRITLLIREIDRLRGQVQSLTQQLSGR